MKTYAFAMVILLMVIFEPAPIRAQDSRIYAGVVGGISTLSGDGRSVTTSFSSAVSLYNPMNGPALDVFGGWALNNYVSFQGNYIWNTNRLTMTSSFASQTQTRFYEQERSSSQHSGFFDVLVYFRALGERFRPYLSTGVGRVDFSSAAEQTLVDFGGAALPPANFSDTTTVLRSAVGLDLRLGERWALRYSFSEFIGPNPIGQQLDPPGQRSLMNFQNLVGFVRYF